MIIKEKIKKMLSKITPDMYVSHGKIRSIAMITENSKEKYIVVNFNGDEIEMTENNLLIELEKVINHKPKRIKFKKDYDLLHKKDDCFEVVKEDEKYYYTKCDKRVKYGVIEIYDGLLGFRKDSKIIEIV